ncbi:serine protease [Staphylococcus aureus]|nr:serine protease [Staphylococcus aureus]
MNKNVMVKGLTALTILTSLGFAENISDQPHSIAKAEKNVKEITDATKAPYNSVVAFAGGTGVVVGKNTIVTNKHIAKSNDIFKNRVSAHHSSKGKGGGNYDVKDIVEYPGKEDLAIVHVHETSTEGLNSKNELIGILYAGSGKDESEKNFGVYFTPQLKEFIQNNIEK